MSQLVYITTEPTQTHLETKTNPIWIHPHLIESTDPIKGRQFRVSAPIPKNTVLLVDRPYSIIPVVDNPTDNDDLICSNPACNRRAPRNTRKTCPNTCLGDVAWCGSVCRGKDSLRHGFECGWLKRYAVSIRSKYGEYDFGMLWIIVRLLASRHCQRLDLDSGLELDPGLKCNGWRGIESLCGSQETWPCDMVKSWTGFVKRYLLDGPLLPHGMSAEQVLHVICQEEANSFGLYPRETGRFPVPWPVVGRGVQYAGAVYPTASMANHSCWPNVVHKADENGHMVFTACRDIFPGEECCISYFDLAEYTDLTSRRERLRELFRFVCRCERCVDEEPEEVSEWIDMGGFMS
ncbi:uncharacterized protein N7515_003383 [Penicillium bovifimosum]|uniref:SET domain-containing protein n=1 Tax=Penicillium bovifimosum TaxID=126998 RepID=A0A9W9H4J8_9EURO|nr:uncharacterized protein N7515_003383 [Penicillium bovifimosum]KAJ5138535.1 hypothetical protein N7515_003383 [Penicillium bovifimosum]